MPETVALCRGAGWRIYKDMCLAVPMRIVELLPEEQGIVEFDGVRQPVRLSLLDRPSVGEYVIVHAGYAIERLDEAEAQARIEVFAELAGAAAETP